MHRAGNEEAGFSIDFDAPARALRVRVWGFWSAELAEKFSKAAPDACRARNATRISIDASALRPQNEAGQAAFRALLEVVPKLGTARASVATQSTLMKMQLLRLVSETGAKDFVEFS